MIKLSEMNNDKALDTMVLITEPLINILSDEELVTEMQKVVKKGTSIGEIKRLGTLKITKIVQIVLEKNRKELYTLLAPFFEKSVEEMAQMNILSTVLGVTKLWKDEALQDFLSELQELSKTADTAKT